MPDQDEGAREGHPATLATLPPMAPMTPQRMPLPAPPPALADSSPAAVVVVWLTWEDVQAVEPYIRDGAAQGHLDTAGT